MVSFVLMIVFLVSGLVFSRSSKELNRLNKLRLEHEAPKDQDAATHALAEFTRRMGMGMAMAPGGDVLKDFCARQGLSNEYNRANRAMYGAILIALACAYFIIKIGPTKT
jgi:hypothetical protein